MALTKEYSVLLRYHDKKMIRFHNFYITSKKDLNKLLKEIEERLSCQEYHILMMKLKPGKR